MDFRTDIRTDIHTDIRANVRVELSVLRTVRPGKGVLSLGTRTPWDSDQND